MFATEKGVAAAFVGGGEKTGGLAMTGKMWEGMNAMMESMLVALIERELRARGVEIPPPPTYAIQEFPPPALDPDYNKALGEGGRILGRPSYAAQGSDPRPEISERMPAWRAKLKETREKEIKLFDELGEARRDVVRALGY